MKRNIYIAIIILIMNSISYSAKPDSGMIAYYPFNGNAFDESGNGNNGIVYGATLTDDRFGRTGNAYSFDHNYIEIPNSSSLQSLTNAMTLTFWINISQWENNAAGFFAKSNSGNIGQYGSVASTSPYIQFDIGGQYVRITRYLALNRWYFISLKWTGQKAILYLNGDAYDSASISGTAASDNSPLILGKHTPGTVNYFLGKLDDIRIYNRSLSAEDIQLLYFETNLDLKIIPQGFYDLQTGRLRMRDTINIFLRETVSPFYIIDSLFTVIDSLSFQGSVKTFIPHASYFIDVKHRNSIETWSSDPVYFEESVNYDFTTSSSQAYGNNQILNASEFCIYSGDENQDGNINSSDVIDINNSSNGFSSGYVSTDIDGSRSVDANDVLFAYNNSVNFVSTISPNNYSAPCNLSCNRMFSWSGFNWCVISSNETTCYPGPNYFSSDLDNVFVDTEGDLHLRITKRNGKFYCPEIFTTGTVGYGTYKFYLSSRVDNLDKNIVFGLFTWNDTNCVTNGNSEIDLEFTRWGESNSPDVLEYSVQPTNGGQESERSSYHPMNQTDNYSIHYFDWTPTSVSFSSYYGNTDPPLPENMIASWVFDNTNPPKSKEECNSDPIVIPDPETNTTLDLNLWLNRGSYPSNDQEAEVTIHRIEFTPFQYDELDEDGNTTFDNVISVPNKK